MTPDFRNTKTKALFVSLSLHGLLFLLLVFNSGVKKPEKTVDIELITISQAVNSSSKELNRTQQTPLPKLKPQKIIKDNNESPLKLSKEKKVAKKEVDELKDIDSGRFNGVIGESDLEFEFKGRAPKNEKERYLALVRQTVYKKQVYPRPSRAFKEQGVVKILLTIHKDGSLKNAEVIQKSKFQRLDQAALNAALKVTSFQAFPETVSFNLWKIKLPIKFTLSSN